MNNFNKITRETSLTNSIKQTSITPKVILTTPDDSTNINEYNIIYICSRAMDTSEKDNESFANQSHNNDNDNN